MLVNVEHKIVIELFEVNESGSDASKIAASVDEMRAAFEERSERIETLSRSDGTRGFAATATRTDGMEQLHTVLQRGGAVAQITITYPAASRAIAAQIAKSLSLDTRARLDSGKLYGLEVGRAEGLAVEDGISMVIVHDVHVTAPSPPNSPSVAFIVALHDTSKGDVSLDSLLDDDFDRTTIKATKVKFDESDAVELVGETVDRGVRVREISVTLMEPGAIFHVQGRCALTDNLDRLRKVIYGTRRVALPPGAVPMPPVEVGTSGGPR